MVSKLNDKIFSQRHSWWTRVRLCAETLEPTQERWQANLTVVGFVVLLDFILSTFLNIRKIFSKNSSLMVLASTSSTLRHLRFELCTQHEVTQRPLDIDVRSCSFFVLCCAQNQEHVVPLITRHWHQHFMILERSVMHPKLLIR